MLILQQIRRTNNSSYLFGIKFIGDYMNFGEILKTLRKNKKISQEELAYKVGVIRQADTKAKIYY